MNEGGILTVRSVETDHLDISTMMGRPKFIRGTTTIEATNGSVTVIWHRDGPAPTVGDRFVVMIEPVSEA